MGMIPEGWSVGKFSDFFEINPTRQLTKDADAPYLEMSNVSKNSPQPIGWVYRKYSSGMKFINGDTLFARITPCLEHGKKTYVDFLPENIVGWGSTEFIVIRSKKPLPLQLSYLFCKDDNFREHAITNMIGSSGRQRVQNSCFDHYYVAVPPKKEINFLSTEFERYFSMIKANSEEIQSLTATRDYLLPRLLSGDVRVE
jgi:type I restriction enzyme S subunit